MLLDYSQLDFIDPKLREILFWLEGKTGVTFTTTSIFRIGDKGVHGTLPVRGWDLRIRDRRLGEVIVDIINEAWVYDPERPIMGVADDHGVGSNYHIHLQVHENTIRRKK